MTPLAVAVVLGLSLSLTASAQLSTYWAKEDIQFIQTRATELARSSQSIKDIYFALQFLKQFDQQTSVCDCKYITNVANSDQSTAFHITYAMRAADLCNCPFSPSTSSVEVVRSSLQSDSPTALAGALSAAAHLSQFTSEDKSSAFRRLHTAISNEDNTLKGITLENTPAQVAQMHSVLDALHALHKDTSLSDDLVASTVKAFLENYSELLPGGREDQAADVTLLVPLRRLSEKRLRLLPSALAACAEAVVALKLVDSDMQTAFHAYEAAAYVASLKTAPVVATLAQASFPAATPVRVEVLVHDLLGNALNVEAMEVAHVKGIGKDMTFAQGVQVQGAVLDLSSETLLPGRYHVSLKVAIKDKSTPAVLQTYLVVTEVAQVAAVQIGVSKSVDGGDLLAVAQPRAATAHSLTASADELDVLHVAFEVRGDSGKVKKPHQAFVRLTLLDGAQKGHSVFALATRSGDELQFHAALSLGEELGKFDYLSGQYEVAVLVGDAAYSQAVEFVLGAVSLRFPAKPSVSYSLYAKSLLHTSDTTLLALPEIEHVMRPPAHRASPFMSTAFTALTWLPLLVFVGFVLSLKPDLSRLRSLSALLYVVVVAVTLVLYCGYWLSWPGFDFYATVKYICVLVPAVVVVGRWALQAVMDVRHQQLAAKQKTA